MFTISNLLKRGANYLLMVLLARTLPVAIIGSYSAYINIIGVLLLITNFGFSEYVLVNSENDPLRKNKVSIFLQISFMLFFVLLLLSLLVPLNDVRLAVLVLFKIFLETSTYNILLAHYQARNKIKVMSIANMISGCSVIVISILFYLNSHQIYTYLVYINIIYLAVTGTLFLKIKFRVEPISKIWSFLRTRFSDLQYYGISMVTIPVYMMAPTVIGSFILEPKVLAQYQIAFSIANILLLVSVSLLQEGYANFLVYRNNVLGLTKALKKTGIKIISANLFFLVLFVVFGEELILLVYKKEEYLKAYYPLLILLFGNMIFMFASIAAVIMVILKLQKEKAKYHLEFIVISIFFGILLTYLYGVYGLASSYIILYSYSTFRYVKKYIKIYKTDSLK